MLQFLPAAIMFLFTVGFASVFLIPATSYTPKDSIVTFYWRGTWVFLSAICAVAGASNAITMTGRNVYAMSDAMLTSLLVTFVLFIMFAWARLAGKAAWYGVKLYLTKRKTPQA